jgi:hypothetical protein
MSVSTHLDVDKHLNVAKNLMLLCDFEGDIKFDRHPDFKAVDLINRSAVVVRPGQPFLNWLHRVDPTSAHLTLDVLRRQPTIYLLPECDTKNRLLSFCERSAARFSKNNLTAGIGWLPFGPRSEI